MGRAFRFAVVFAAALVAVFLIAVPAVGAYATNVTGEWNFTVESPNGTGTPTVTFKQDGETLTGTYKGRFGEAPLKGTVKGNEIKFTLTISPRDRTFSSTTRALWTATHEGQSQVRRSGRGEL